MLARITRAAKNLVAISFSAKHIYTTNTVTCGALLAGGDFIQQNIEKSMRKTQKYDFIRTGRMFLVGLSQGPPHHIWYTWLDKKLPKKDLKTVVFKIIADQLVAAPFFAITFFYGMGILQNKKLSECWNEFTKKFPAVYLFDWCIWPPTQYVNFVFVPSQYRVVYVNFVTVVWNVFLSYMKHFDEIQSVDSP